MDKKNLPKKQIKLVISKVRELDAQELRNVVGGYPPAGYTRTGCSESCNRDK